MTALGLLFDKNYMFENDEIIRFNYLFLIIETIGLILAFIELRAPKVANGITNLILTIASQFQKSVEPTIRRVSSKIAKKIIGSLVLLVVIGSAFQWSVESFLSGNYFIAACFSGITFVSLCWISVKWIESKPLGTLGVLLASFGLVGSVYQIVYF